MLATIRPDDWNIALLLHVLGAMLLVGALVLAVTALVLSWRDGDRGLTRLAFRALLVGALPAYVLMRVGAQWIASKEGLEDSDVAWIGIGYTTADMGALLIIVSTILAGLALRRANRDGGAGGTGRTATVLVSLLIVAYVVTTWAMAAKPL